MKVLNEIFINMYPWRTLVLTFLDPQTFCFLTSFQSIKETFLQAHDSLVSLIIFCMGFVKGFLKIQLFWKSLLFTHQLSTLYDSCCY